MTKAISLRVDYDGTELRRLAKKVKDAAQVRRLLALASIYDGGSRQYGSKIGGVTVQIVRDWVLRFNERGPVGLINTKAPGSRAKLNDGQRQALAKIVESGPTPPSTAWSAGDVRTSCSGCSRNSGSLSTRRRLGES